MKFFKNRFLPAIVLSLVIFITGCDKTKPYDTTIPPAKVHFAGSKTQVYSVVVDPAPVYNVVVGTTDVAATDRIVTYNVTSPSGAVAGTQYTIGTTGTVTIPAGQTTANIDVHGIYSQYLLGQKDTLLFTLAKPSVDVAAFQDTLRLILKGPCSENDIVFDELTGDYANSNENLAGMVTVPYTTTISSITSTGPTTASIVVQNFWTRPHAWGPVTFNIDWTDPFHTTTTIVEDDDIPGSDAGDLDASFAGLKLAVRPDPVNGPGTYSYCDQKFTFNMQLGITNLGWFGNVYQVILER